MAILQHEVLDDEIICQGYVNLHAATWRYQRFAGGWSEPMRREYVKRPAVAAVLPYDPVSDRVVLLQQARIGALDDAESPWLWEIVAGIYDHDGESMEALASREAQEEAGLHVQALKSIYQYWASPGASSEYVHLFCGKVVAPDEGGIFGLPEEWEDIQTSVFSSEQAFAMLEQGKIRNAIAIIALQWLKCHREKLQQSW